MKRIDLLASVPTEQSAIAWLQSRGILPVVTNCGTCRGDVSFNLEKGEYRCTRGSCRRRRSVTTGTIFEGAKLSLSTIVMIMYEWCIETPVGHTAYQYQASEAAVSRWYATFRRYASNFWIENCCAPIGGEGEIVEIDECLLVKHKNHVGRVLRNQKWIFGGGVRGDPSQCFIEFVPDRTRDTLLEIIKRRISPGSLIVSDGWRSYYDLPVHLPEMNYLHEAVNHSVNFVDPENYETHTQNVEGFWSVVKRKLRAQGTHHGKSMKRRIYEFLYRKRFGYRCFEVFVGHLGRLNYPLPRRPTSVRPTFRQL